MSPAHWPGFDASSVLDDLDDVDDLDDLAFIDDADLDIDRGTDTLSDDR